MNADSESDSCGSSVSTTTRNQLPITVVIPAYNAEPFLAKALEGVRAQTRPPAEVIVVDDGSTDCTAAIAEAHGARVYRQPNAGLSFARNRAILAASQPWIAFLDADDVWDPEKLERQWAAVEADPTVNAVFTDFTEFDANGPVGVPFLSRIKHYAEIRRKEIAPGVMLCDEESFRRAFFKGNLIVPSTFLVRRDLLLEVGLFDPTLRYREDRELWLRLMPLAKVAVIERCLMWARVHESNLSGEYLNMLLGTVEVAQRIFAHPDRYPLGAVDQYRRELPAVYLNAGRVTEEAGDLARARGYYRTAWRLGGGARPLALAMLSHFPRPVRAVVRVAVRRARGLVSSGL